MERKAFVLQGELANNSCGQMEPFVESLVPVVVLQIETDAKDVVRSTEDLEKIARKVALQLQSLRSQYDSVMSPIRDVCSL